MRKIILNLPIEIVSYLELCAAKDDVSIEVGVEMLLIEWVYLLKAKRESAKAADRAMVKAADKAIYEKKAGVSANQHN